MAGGGFAGGLADGLNNIMGLYMQNKYYSGLNDNRERNLDLKEEALAAKNAKADSGGGGKKGADREGFMNSLIPIFNAGSGNQPQATPQQPPVMANTAGLGAPAAASPTTLPDAGLMTGNAPAAYQAGSLAAPTQAPAQAAPAEPQVPANPIHEIVRQMAFGDLANQPEKLNAIHAAAVLHGMGDEVSPWLQGIYKAKKSGLFDAAMDLKRGNVDGAMANLKNGGINLEDRPVKVNPDDPNDSKWKINISGSGEKTIDLDDWATSTLDPEKYSKFVTDKQENATKGRVADAQINNYNANAKESLAGVGLKNAQARSEKTDGSNGGLSKLPAPAATAEWLVQKGVHSNYKDAFNAVKTLNGKSPEERRDSLIEASMKNGSTAKEAAKEVDELLADRKPTGTPPPKGTTRVFNPKTGKFD